MADIDLIPEEYRYWCWQRRCMKIAGIAAVAVAVVCALLSIQFAAMEKSATLELNTIKSQQQISQNQQVRFETVSKERQDLQSQWALLNGLRGGATVESLFEDIDLALDGDRVWFKQWQFQRSGQPANGDSIEDLRKNGAHVIELASGPSEGISLKQAWAISTHLNLEGGADDHAALSLFVDRLLRQTRIVSVKVLNTSLMQQQDGEAISFRLSVAINNATAVQS